MDILISEDLDSPAVRKLAEKYRVVRNSELWRDVSGLKNAIREARTIMVRNQTQLTAELLESAPELIAIGRVGVGLDNIAVKTATEKGIVVISPVHANATSVAELAVGLMLALARRIPYGDRTTKEGGWERRACTGIEIDRKTLALCGFGRIGRMVAVRARAMGMRIAVFDPLIDSDSPALGEVGAILCNDLSEALAVADFVSVHLPLTPETRHMFNAERFAGMKGGAFFINTSRGQVVDEGALVQALESGHLGGAALDVREVEPPRERSALETMANVILMPHVGAFTVEAQARTFEAVCEDIDRLLQGESARNFVNIPQPSRES